MPKINLTDRTLKSLKPKPGGKPFDIMDAVVPGFGVRILGTVAQPVRTFVLVTRFPGSRHPTRRAIGPYGVLTLEKGREKAREWLELIQSGIDPQVETERQRQAIVQQQEGTFGAVVEEFIKRHLAKTRQGHDAELAIRRELIPRWADRPITSITRQDVLVVIDALAERGAPYAAHALFAQIRRIFNWAIGRGKYPGLNNSPCDRLKPSHVIGRKEPRSRVLNDSEIGALQRAADRVGYPFGPMIKLLLFTGTRKNEAAQASWDEIDFDKKVWTVPAIRMKSNGAHIVPLSADVIDLLRSLPGFEGPYIFSTAFGRRPVSGFSKAKARLDRAMLEEFRREVDECAELVPWVVHDLRRVVKTGLAELRVPDHVSELVLAHQKKGLSRVYDQFLYLDERREALTAWAVRLRAIVEPPPSNVVALSH